MQFGATPPNLFSALIRKGWKSRHMVEVFHLSKACTQSWFRGERHVKRRKAVTMTWNHFRHEGGVIEFTQLAPEHKQILLFWIQDSNRIKLGHHPCFSTAVDPKIDEHCSGEDFMIWILSRSTMAIDLHGMCFHSSARLVRGTAMARQLHWQQDGRPQNLQNFGKARASLWSPGWKLLRYFYLIRGAIRIATTGGRVSRVAVHPMDGGVLNGHKDNGEGHPPHPRAQSA